MLQLPGPPADLLHHTQGYMGGAEWDGGLHGGAGWNSKLHQDGTPCSCAEAGLIQHGKTLKVYPSRSNPARCRTQARL